MEIKKSRQADLERKRPQRLLLGLVMALACFFIVMELNIEPDDPLDDESLLARLDNDMELPPLLHDDTEQLLAPKAEPKPETKIVVVEEESDEPLTDDELIETDAGDDVEPEETIDEIAPPPPPDDDVVSLRVVQDVPQFPGGPIELMKWLTRNLKYPSGLEQQQVKGRVLAEFIVNADGSITNVAVVTPLHPRCDAEVLRVLRMMPRWTPGIMNDEPCRTKVCIPVIFNY